MQEEELCVQRSQKAKKNYRTPEWFEKLRLEASDKLKEYWKMRFELSGGKNY